PYSSCSRCPVGLSPLTCTINCVGYLEQALQDPNGGIPLPAAVVLEMVQGEGGVVPAHPDFVARVRARSSTPASATSSGSRSRSMGSGRGTGCIRV
ncbi:MAG: hypothetical protein ACRDUV_01385, partial [Pseudonocardiaceae bacterium]